MSSILMYVVLTILNLYIGEQLRKQGKDYRLNYFAAGMCFLAIFI